MNLAEALRKAAADSGHNIIATVDNVPQSVPQEPLNQSSSGNAIRLEMFLDAEQMAHMLKALLHGQHSVMTVGEAAHYLRVRAATIGKMADEGQLNGIQIDGKWRFTKTALDEWVAQNTSNEHEENQDVA